MSRATPAPSARDHAGARAPSDESLLRQAQLGDQAVAVDIYFRYADRLRSLLRSRLSRPLARHLEAEDLVQSTFRRFLQGAAGRRFSLPESGELWDLLLVIALNRLRAAENYHRAACRDLRQSVGLPADGSVPDGEDAESREIAEAVREAMSLMPPHFREALALRLEGLEVDEIARRMGRTRRTTERILQQARAQLRKFVGGEDAS
jgi:RNA polymerase sigma-70 factor (ECF subfamily)